MTPWVIVPVKSLADGKSRLAGQLTPAQRRDVNAALLSATLDVCARFAGLPRTVVVSRCEAVLQAVRQRGAMPLPESGAGLNGAVQQALGWLRARTAEPVVVLSCDLPCARIEDLQALVHPVDMVLATDRAGDGTNAIGLPAGATLRRFRYGPRSRWRHADEAAQARLRMQVLEGGSLAFDVDTPRDWRDWVEGRAPHGPDRHG